MQLHHTDHPADKTLIFRNKQGDAIVIYNGDPDVPNHEGFIVQDVERGAIHDSVPTLQRAFQLVRRGFSVNYKEYRAFIRGL